MSDSISALDDAHGLHKAAATVAAKNGATAHDLTSIFGWLTLSCKETFDSWRATVDEDGHYVFAVTL
jgi:hypothetical protein